MKRSHRQPWMLQWKRLRITQEWAPPSKPWDYHDNSARQAVRSAHCVLRRRGVVLCDGELKCGEWLESRSCAKVLLLDKVGSGHKLLHVDELGNSFLAWLIAQKKLIVGSPLVPPIPLHHRPVDYPSGCFSDVWHRRQIWCTSTMTLKHYFGSVSARMA